MCVLGWDGQIRVARPRSKQSQRWTCRVEHHDHELCQHDVAPSPLLLILSLYLWAVNAPHTTVSGSSSFSTCKGIQGAGKDADVCCAAECLCTCGGTSEENAGKECFLTGIRDDPPGYCTGTELATEACSLPAGTRLNYSHT